MFSMAVLPGSMISVIQYICVCAIISSLCTLPVPMCSCTKLSANLENSNSIVSNNVNIKTWRSSVLAEAVKLILSEPHYDHVPNITNVRVLLAGYTGSTETTMGMFTATYFMWWDPLNQFSIPLTCPNCKSATVHNTVKMSYSARHIFHIDSNVWLVSRVRMIFLFIDFLNVLVPL